MPLTCHIYLKYQFYPYYLLIVVRITRVLDGHLSTLGLLDGRSSVHGVLDGHSSTTTCIFGQV